VANDFFFSGHTAIAVLGAIELANVAPGWVAIAGGLIAFLEAATVLVLRAHYTMDVLAAVFAAFCAASLAARFVVGF
jgi:membrane-associated phospholipid phosphatase